MNGLGNLGNTCFLNSCLQALFATTELGQLLDKQRNIKDIPDAKITTEWNELRQMMTQGTVIPRQFVFHIQQIAKLKKKDIFTGWSQNDMPEFLLFMLDCIHNSISRKVNINIKGTSKNATDETAIKCYTMLKDTYAKEYSEMMDLFFGIYVSSIKSENGRTTHSIKPESFFILDLPVPQGGCLNEGATRRFPPSIYQCFDLMTATEHMSGDNAWLNEKTGKKESIQKQLRFWSLPKVLVIVLKRFSPDGRSKMNGLVSFPMTGLDLSKYVCGYNPKSYVYDLYAVCNHMGGVMGGHYTAYAKKDNVWYHCNDQSVSQIDANVVVSPAAYCLFYRSRGTA
jgi:ubiquitin C-terminal hydrolase